MSNSFQFRYIGVTISIGKGANGEDGSDDYKLTEGLEISAQIDLTGGQGMSTCQVRIAGISQDLMNKLTTLGLSPNRIRNNHISVFAGDTPGSKPLIFRGTIWEAWGDYSGSPNVYLVVDGRAGLREAVLASSPTSFAGVTKVETIIRTIATKMGVDFENQGVDETITDPHYTGSAREQIIRCAKEAHIECNILPGSDQKDRVVIWKKGTSRGQTIPLISYDNGMVGYPTMANGNTVAVTCLFRPELSFGMRMKIKSSLPSANAEWIIYHVAHVLDAQVPGGQWFTMVEGYRPLLQQNAVAESTG